jgi:hypothetical protein
MTIKGLFETLLSLDEVIFLTGYRYPSKQIGWLRQNHIHHYVSKDGHPRVPRTAIDRPLRSVGAPRTPKFDALNKGVHYAPKTPY